MGELKHTERFFFLATIKYVFNWLSQGEMLLYKGFSPILCLKAHSPLKLHRMGFGKYLPPVLKSHNLQ